MLRGGLNRAEKLHCNERRLVAASGSRVLAPSFDPRRKPWHDLSAVALCLLFSSRPFLSHPPVLPRSFFFSSPVQLTERRRGNEAYTARDFARAHEHYARADAIVETVEALSRADERELETCRLAVRLNLSALALARGEPREAEVQATRALEIDPYNAKALLRRARARGTQGRLEDAREDLQAAARVDPIGAQEAAEDIAREESRARERQKAQLKGMFDRAPKKKAQASKGANGRKA